MAARTPSFINIGFELGFVLAAGVMGWFAAPYSYLVALAATMILFWIWNRRVGLKQLADQGMTKLAAAGVISLAIIFAILSGAYVIGRALSGGYA